MDQANLTDSLVFLWSVFLGFLFGVYYEFFRFLRLGFRHPTALVALEDLLFFLPTCAVYILFTFAFSDGVVRMFSLIGTLLGFLFYLVTLGRLFVRMSDSLWRVVRTVARFIVRHFLLPPARIFMRCQRKIRRGISRRIERGKARRRQKALCRQKDRLLLAAKRGFGL